MTVLKKCLLLRNVSEKKMVDAVRKSMVKLILMTELGVRFLKGGTKNLNDIKADLSFVILHRFVFL